MEPILPANHDGSADLRGSSTTVPSSETRLVRVVYEDEEAGKEAPIQERYPVYALGVLAPNDAGEQTLFVHTHLAQRGALPFIKHVEDAETGQIIRVSASWLGDAHSFWD